MIKKCSGCGAAFQSSDPERAGYVTAASFDEAVICRRCFRIKNYGEYQIINKDDESYKIIFDDIKSKNNLVLYVCDILNIDESLNNLTGFKGSVIMVITKKDLLPKSVKERKLVDYIKDNYDVNVLSVIFVSAVKNYHLDMLRDAIIKYGKGNKTYIVGNTNAGKSTIINAFIKAYSNDDSYVTTSGLPATTLSCLEVKINDDITFIDTPGLVMNNNFVANAKAEDIKKITPRSEIRPRTYQLNKSQSLIIDNYARIDFLDDKKNSVTLYLSNDIKVTKININTNDHLRDLNETSFDLPNNNDIVVSGLCFCKIVCPARVRVFTDKNVLVYSRNNLI